MLDKFRETAITWDKANRKVYEPLRVSAGDNKGRKLSVQLVNDGVIEDLSGASLSLFWETRDKTNKGLDAFDPVDATKGEFEIYYTTGMLSNEGTLNANLVLVDTSGRIVSEPFEITVFRGINDDAIQSTDSFTALTKALANAASGRRFMGTTTFADLPSVAETGDYWWVSDQSIYRMRSASGQWVDIGTGEDMSIFNDTYQSLINDLGLYQEINIAYPDTTMYLTNGTTGVYTGWNSSGKIPCDQYQSVRFGAPNYRNPAIAAIAFFDANDNFISGLNNTSGPVIDATYYFYEGEADIPINAKTMVIAKVNRSASIQSPNYLFAKLKGAEYDLDQIERNRLAIETLGGGMSDQSVLCIGDSLTEGDYGSNPAGTKNVKPENYPYFMQKYLGCSVQNAGKSGYSALMYWNNTAQTLNYADKDVAIIMLGTNVGLTDTLEADTTISAGQTYLDYANTNTGAYCKIIEHAYAQSGGKIQIILVTPPHVGDRRISNKVAAEGAYPVVKKIGQKYKIPVIDMNESGFSKFTESVMQPVDGLHFGLLGYKKMGTFIGSQLKSLLSYEID